MSESVAARQGNRLIARTAPDTESQRAEPYEGRASESGDVGSHDHRSHHVPPRRVRERGGHMSPRHRESYTHRQVSIHRHHPRHVQIGMQLRRHLFQQRSFVQL